MFRAAVTRGIPLRATAGVCPDGACVEMLGRTQQVVRIRHIAISNFAPWPGRRPQGVAARPAAAFRHI